MSRSAFFKGCEMISNNEIKNDLAAFEIRIDRAKKRLQELPGWCPTWKERTANKRKRHFLEGEILHVQNLIDMARKAVRVIYFPRPEI